VRGGRIGAQPPADVEAGQAGHADVRQGHIGLERYDAVQRHDAVKGLADQLESWVLVDQPRHAAAIARVVVRDEHPHVPAPGFRSFAHASAYMPTSGAR
jgi:hypothetical protein